MILILKWQSNGFTLESNTSRYWDLYTLSGDVMLSNSEYSRLLKPISEGKGALIAALSFQREKLGSVEVIHLFLFCLCNGDLLFCFDLSIGAT